MYLQRLNVVRAHMFSLFMLDWLEPTERTKDSESTPPLEMQIGLQMVTPNINHKNHVSKTGGNAISVKTLTQMIISLTRLTQLTIDLTRFDISCILDSLLPNMKRFFCSNYHVHVQLF